MNTVLDGLNPEQRAAAACIDAPVLIVAGAGSGKTRVLTARIAWLIKEKGVAPERILALTFTKKAAQEMKERIAAMVGERQARRIWMGTFHSVFIRFLRDYADRIGYPQNFTIYDTSDSQSAIKACVKQLQLDDKVYKPREVLSKISMAKNGLFTAATYAESDMLRENDRVQKKPELYRIFQAYEVACRQSGVMDFDDILLNMCILLRDCPDACAEIAARFDHILVDEYQDTNRAQFKILYELAKDHRNICVVGDDSQSIYAFRGADIRNILQFRQTYPGCRLFRLESNYRSTQMIVNASNTLIARNEGRIPKKCHAVGGEGEKIRLVRAFDEMTEATLVTGTILARMREEKCEYRDFAILYRTNAQSRALEEALRKRNLPYMVYSGNSFFDRAEVKDLMAYFKLVVNPGDDESFKRVVNKPARGIGDTSVGALTEAARAAGVPLMQAAFSENLDQHGLRNAAIVKFREFCGMILKLHEQAETTDAYELVRSIADASGLYLFYKSDNSIEGQARTANVEELLDAVARFAEDTKAERRAELLAEGQYNDETDIPDELIGTVTLGAFLEDISLLSNADTTSEDGDTNKIALMTAHSAKGLEFPHVIVVGMEENLFPSMSMLYSTKDIEEERRLFYVAMTRAKQTLTCTFSESRMRNGRHESNAPSRFLYELDKDCVANPLRRDTDIPGESGVSRGGWSAGRPSTPWSAARSGASYGSRPEPRPAPSRAAATRPAAPSAPGKVTLESLRTRTLPDKIPDAEFIPVSMDKIVTGIRVEHNRFGLGTVLEVSGRIPDLKAKIRFDQYGEKILLLKFAKLRLPETR